jgi:hypothetical protein
MAEKRKRSIIHEKEGLRAEIDFFTAKAKRAKVKGDALKIKLVRLQTEYDTANAEGRQSRPYGKALEKEDDLENEVGAGIGPPINAAEMGELIDLAGYKSDSATFTTSSLDNMFLLCQTVGFPVTNKSVFVDLGSGTGQAVLYMAHMGVGVCRGYENNAARLEMAVSMDLMAKQRGFYNPLESFVCFHQYDLATLQYVHSQATHLFWYSKGMHVDVANTISGVVVRRTPGMCTPFTRIVLTDYKDLGKNSNVETLGTFRMTDMNTYVTFYAYKVNTVEDIGTRMHSAIACQGQNLTAVIASLPPSQENTEQERKAL